MRVFLAKKANLSTKDPFTVQSQSSLCDLRDLCAMLSLIRVFPGQAPSRPRKDPITVRSQSSLCDLRDLCAMLSLIRAFPGQAPSRPPKTLSPSNLNPPFVTSGGKVTTATSILIPTAGRAEFIVPAPRSDVAFA
jgi:hypothetical protein